jgi:hypothetical protein
MRTLLTGLLSSFIFISANGHAIEPVLDQHAMLYYQVPLGASNSKEARHNFGFRIDRQMIQPGEIIQYQSLLRQPAVVDIRMGYTGIQELRVNGIDYVEQYYVQHGADTEETVEGTGEEDSGESDKTEGEKKGFEKLMHSIPAGVLIGAGILGALLLNND